MSIQIHHCILVSIRVTHEQIAKRRVPNNIRKVIEVVCQGTKTIFVPRVTEKLVRTCIQADPTVGVFGCGDRLQRVSR